MIEGREEKFANRQDELVRVAGEAVSRIKDGFLRGGRR
jgi:hypothetical protein